MEQPTTRSHGRGRSIRTAMYPEVVRASVWLRWLLLLAGALWLYMVGPEGGRVAWVILAVAIYNTALTVLQRLDRHPPLMIATSLDLVAVVSLLILRSTAEGSAFVIFGLFILMLVLAYGWAGVALSLGAYVIGESAVSLIQPAALPDLQQLLTRGGFFTVLAVVLGALVERYEGLGERLARVSIHDRVTGLYNRHYFAEALEHIHKLAIRAESTYSVLVIDVDGLDSINKEQGWSAGDRVLRTIGVEARTAIRSTDLLGRVGEDEFAMALPETALPAAETVARKLQKRLRPVAAGLGVKIGVASVTPTWDNGFEDGLRAAFGALEEAKTDDDDRVALVVVEPVRAEEDR